MKLETIFDAAREGDLATVISCVENGADLGVKNDFGFTALHCAAMGTDVVEPEIIIEVLQYLVEAGSPLESLGDRGRTALYLAAEFSDSVEPVKFLLDAGAQANICDEHDHHIIENAMSDEVKALLSQRSGKSVPAPSKPEPKDKVLTRKEWKAAKKKIDSAFAYLSKQGLITFQDVGYTQSDGFSDCVEEFHQRGGEAAGIVGFCFYTRQDLEYVKSTGKLILAFWGAPEGADEAMIKIGNLVVEAFTREGYAVDWDAVASTRPTVYVYEALDL